MDEEQAEQTHLLAVLGQWQADMDAQIENQGDLTVEQKAALKEVVEAIIEEAARDEAADVGLLESLLNTIGAATPDLQEVTAASIVQPLEEIGIGVVNTRERIELKRAGDDG